MQQENANNQEQELEALKQAHARANADKERDIEVLRKQVEAKEREIALLRQ